MKELFFLNRTEWRKWLENNHDKSNVVWLIYYKKHTHKESIKQPEAVEEALCYGWIDSIVRTIDDERYMQKFTPRNDKSIWSDINKKRVKDLVAHNKMTKFGLAKVNIAKESGMWNKVRDTTNLDFIPEELEKKFVTDNTLKQNWDKLAPSHKKQYLYWINTAKKEETKIRRLNKSVELILKNEKLGMV